MMRKDAKNAADHGFLQRKQAIFRRLLSDFFALRIGGCGNCDLIHGAVADCGIVPEIAFVHDLVSAASVLDRGKFGDVIPARLLAGQRRRQRNGGEFG